jgi:hypothetical protein
VRGKKLVGILATSLAWLAAVPVAGAAPIAPGFDLFETDPQATVFQFRDQFTIPAGFFGPGSQPFTGNVNFAGDPLQVFQGHDVGDADTVVHRPQAADLNPPFPAQAVVPIELVALNLVSVQPIVVQVGTEAQRWDVRATLSPTRPSQGQMRIVQSANQGGAFDSQLMVLPKFTFTRLSDATSKELDVGQLPPQFSNQLVLQSSNVPWRGGCVAPALSVPGLNDGFCPAFTPDGIKQLGIEESRYARHGVRPAQPQLEHFKCYAIAPVTPFRQRSVTLTDQFGATRARALAPLDLCTPVQKNRERLVNRTAHLKCYGIRDQGFRQRNVAVRNQFGFDSFRVVKALSLCLPSLKTPLAVRRAPKVAAGTLTDHFECYQVRTQAPFASRTATLRDQFGTEQVSVLRPVALCAPVQKNRSAVQHPVRHLVCYAILDPRPFRPRTVRVFNQFGAEVVKVVRPRTLCVPSVKILTQ